MAVLSARGNNSSNESCDRDYLEHVSCYQCGKSKSNHFIEAEDDLSGMPGSFQFVQCTDCGLVYQNPRIKIEHIKDYYNDDYIAYRKQVNWGVFTKFYEAAMNKHDQDKDKITSQFCNLDAQSKVIDFGCAVGSFLGYLKNKYNCEVWGQDFKDFSSECLKKGVSFKLGLAYDIKLPDQSFDLVTMWHFLEHDYDPIRTLQTAKRILKKGGIVVIEVPRLDSLSFKVFRNRWPGLQAPQHTVLYTKDSLKQLIDSSGLKLVSHMPYGAFPPFFYWYAGFIFNFTKGRGVNFRKQIIPYFVAQLITWPLFAIFAKRNLAMQTVVCQKE